MDKERNKVKKNDVILDYVTKIHLYFIFSLKLYATGMFTLNAQLSFDYTGI